MKILFVGETWNGSSARSLREGLASLPGVEIDDIGEDHFFPRGCALLVRVANRALRPWQRRELAHSIEAKLAAFRPEAFVVYKGTHVETSTVLQARAAGILTVNVFPDCSPHAHGASLRAAVGGYDLVISTKPFHQEGWEPVYGYSNRCEFVPHGYDPAVHLWGMPPTAPDLDVVMAGTWRHEYHQLMTGLAAELADPAIKVGVMGAGWAQVAADLPPTWMVEMPRVGRAYGEWLRRGKIVVAPVTREIMVNGVQQPGDEDSTRTYELAAMGCFFLHRRTPYAQTLYDEGAEVPMWDDINELARLVRHYLPLENERRAMASRAHTRAVPAYSISSRAKEVARLVRQALEAQGAVASRSG